MAIEEPLIWTSKGNLPIRDLECRRYWQENDDAITLVEEYWLGEEMVKRGAHVKLKRGATVGTAQGGI